MRSAPVSTSAAETEMPGQATGVLIRRRLEGRIVLLELSHVGFLDEFFIDCVVGIVQEGEVRVELAADLDEGVV